jgi:hypothetical protein
MLTPRINRLCFRDGRSQVLAHGHYICLPSLTGCSVGRPWRWWLPNQLWRGVRNSCRQASAQAGHCLNWVGNGIDIVPVSR